MIVRDEIELLGSCLDAARPFVDEVVIADTGSEDGTWEWVRERADRSLRIPWRDHFAEARNQSLAAASGDWVLILDADERIEGDAAALRRALAEPRALAWRLRVRSDVGTGSEEFHAVRLFRRRPDLRFSGRVHEQVTPALREIAEREPGWRVADLAAAHVEHAGYHPRLACARSKRERNVRLLRRALEESPGEPYLHYKLFQALGAGSQESAVHLDAAARLLLAASPAELRRQATAAEALTAAAQGWLAAGRVPQARAACRRVLDELGPHPATRLVHGQALLAAGQTAEAVPEIERALVEPPPASGFHYDREAFQAAGRRLLALARQRSGVAPPRPR